MRALIVLLLLASCQGYSLQKSSAQYGNAKNKANDPKQNPNDPSRNISIAECSDCFDVQTPHTETEKRDTYDARNDSLYRWYLRATIIGVCGGLCGLVALILQTIATHKAADAAKKSADALINSERALIQANVNAYHPFTTWVPPPHLDFVWLRVYIKNFGRTPAVITNIVARSHVLPKNRGIWPPRLPEIPVYEPSPADPHVTVHEREMTLLPRQKYPVITEINMDDLRSIKAKESMLYVYGYVDYIDIGNTKRQTRFCKLYWIPVIMYDPQEEGFKESSIIPAAYTRST